MAETVPDVRKPRPGGRAARVRAAVLAAARDEFAEFGYGGLSPSRIAERAGVNRSTIHRRWDSLDDLVAEALIGHVAAAIPAPDTGDAREDLQQLLRSIASYVDTQAARAQIHALVGDAVRSPAIGAIVKSVWTARFRIGEEVIARAVSRGEIRADVPAAVIVTTLVGPLYVRLLLTGERIDDTFINTIIEIVLDGTTRSPSEPGRRA
jgi:AcrR family transcriptional regulator